MYLKHLRTKGAKIELYSEDGQAPILKTLEKHVLNPRTRTLEEHKPPQVRTTYSPITA